MTQWIYATLFREPAPGAIPQAGLQECRYDRVQTPSGRMAWGEAVYNRQLTDAEIKSYELEYMGEERQ